MTNMFLVLLNATAIFFYLISSLILLKDIQTNQFKQRALIMAWVAVISHAGIIIFDAIQQYALDFTLFHIGSFISLVISLFILLASFSKPVEKLGILLFPMTVLMLVLDMNFADDVKTITHYSSAMNTHIISSIIAFSLLTIAAVQALLLSLQNKQLKTHNPARFMRALPPLQAMEALLFQMITTGLLFLSLSLVSGFIFIEDLFSQHLAHKTLLSIFAWFIFSSLLIGRKYYGWRGKTAINGTLYGFICLLLSYFGSKLVLELILEKAVNT